MILIVLKHRLKYINEFIINCITNYVKYCFIYNGYRKINRFKVNYSINYYSMINLQLTSTFYREIYHQ